MHDEPRRILCQLLLRYGAALSTDPRRTEALLRDLAPGYPREIFVLVNAQKQRVPADLLAAPNWLPQQALHAQLIRRLEENLAFTPAAAAWAVETWATALHTQPDRSADHIVRQLNRLLLTPKRAGNWWVTKWRQIDNSGVQYVFETFRTLWPPVADAYAWLWRRRAVLWRTPVLLTAALVVALLVVSASSPPSPSVEPPPDLTVQWLTGAYPLPRPAWVSGGPLTVRSGPATTTAALDLLPVGQTIEVVAFSDDGEWSQIQHPASGWVNNHYLHFHSEGKIAHDTTIVLARGRVHSALAYIHSEPGVDYPTVGALPVGSAIVMVATAVDAPWHEIASPIHGWLRADMLDLEKETKDSE